MLVSLPTIKLKKVYMFVIKDSKLKEFVIDVFIQMGCPKDDAFLAADVLLAADLRGIDSHGVARLTGYVRLCLQSY